MRRIVKLAMVPLLAMALVGCSGADTSSLEGLANGAERTLERVSSTAEKVKIKTSPDKYTHYVKNYVGMNAASVGYTALDGLRHDSYGAGRPQIVYVTPDGAFVNPQDKDELKKYAVVAQNCPPNTEMKLEFMKDSDGNEYDNLVSWMNIDQIVLSVNKVGDKSGKTIDMTEIQPSPDRYSAYVRDYVGRNLAECGYVSLANELTDAYGHGYVTFDITTDDGSYIELSTNESTKERSQENTNLLSQYVVVSQSVDPNTPITMTYLTDPNGEEYENLVSESSVSSIALTVQKIS